MRLIATFLLFVSCATAPAAQEIFPNRPDYMPLEIGNEWQFYVTSERAGLPPIPDEYLRQRVASTLVHGNDLYYIFEWHRADLTGTATSPLYSCAYNFSRGIIPTWSPPPLPNYNCSRVRLPPWELHYTPITRHQDSTVIIGNGHYPVDSLATIAFSTQGSGQSFSVTRFTYARGIGPTEHVYFGREHASTSCGTSTGNCTFRADARLVYAQVGSAVYGTTAVSSETDSAPGLPLHLSAYPNPSEGPTHLNIETAGLPARVWVVDMLGRRVWETETSGGMSRLRLPDLAPGPYAVFAGTADGRTVSTSLTRLSGPSR